MTGLVSRTAPPGGPATAPGFYEPARGRATPSPGASRGAVRGLRPADPAPDDPRYAPFVGRAELRSVLGHTLPVAHVEDVLQGKLWAFQDDTRRPSKRQKDLADIARLIEAYPDLRARVPEDVLRRLV